MPGGTEIGPGSSKEEQFISRHVRNNEYDHDAEEEEEEEAGSIIPDRAGKHSFCRLCLTHSDLLSPLFPQNAAPDQTLLAQIYDCVDVQIMLPDDIKSFICTECVQQINSFACFKELCKSNDQLLKSQSFGQESENDEVGGSSSICLTPEVTIVSEENLSSTPDTTLLNKLFQQGVEVEPIGGGHSNALVFGSQQLQQQQLLVGAGNFDDKEAERKAKNAARMRRWRMRQRIKQESQQIVATQEQSADVVEQSSATQEATLEQEEALRIQQAREMFAFLAQQQLRQVEAEIRRLKEGVQQQDEQEQVKEPVEQIKLEPMLQQKGESSRRTSPTSESQLASLRRSRAEYMRKWRARRQSQQQQIFGVVGRPPTISPAPGEVEKLILQRHNRAEYMRRWRRERLKQELTAEEFDLWCAKSEQRRRFQHAMRESASSAGDDTMDCGGESDADRSCYSFDGLPQQS